MSVVVVPVAVAVALPVLVAMAVSVAVTVSAVAIPRTRPGGIEQRSLVPALAPSPGLIVRHAYGDAPRAGAAVSVVGREVEVVDAAVTISAPLGAKARDVAAESGSVRTRVPASRLVHRLILPDRRDGDRHGVAVGIGNAAHGHPALLVVGRPQRLRARRHGGAVRRSVHRRDAVGGLEVHQPVAIVVLT